MKNYKIKLYIILLLSPLLSLSQVNLSTYGVVGDGVTDDTTALQAAFDSGNDLVADSNLTIRYRSQLVIDANGNQSVDFNNSTLSFDSTSSYSTYGILIQKDSGKISLSNFVLDGNDELLRGITIYSLTDFDNVEVHSIVQPQGVGQGCYGIRVALAGFDGVAEPNSEGTYTWNDIHVHDVVAHHLNGDTGGALGSSNGVTVYWDMEPQSQILLNITDLVIHDIWGSDSGCLYTETRGNESVNTAIANTNSLMTVTNGNFYNSERRRGKLFGGNATYTNCTFTSPNGNDNTLPFITYLDPDGECAGDGTFCDAGNVGISEERSTFINCVFNDPYNYDSRVIGVNFGDITFENCQFLNGSDLAVTLSIGDISVCESSFSSTSTLYAYGSQTWNGIVTLDTDNVYGDGFSNFANITSNRYTQTDLTCAVTPIPSCSDGVQNGSETGVDCGGICAECVTPNPGTDLQNNINLLIRH